MTTTTAVATTDKRKFALLSEAAVKAMATPEKNKYLFERFAWMVDQRRAELSASMPRHVDADRLLRIALTEIRKTPKLLECDVATLLMSVQNAASLGLELGGPLGQAYLVPYKDKAELIIGYKGLLTLARRSGDIKAIDARAVFSGDTFTYEYGITPSFRHAPCGETDPTKMTHVYAIAHFKDGGYQIEVMHRAQVVKIRDVALAKMTQDWQRKASPWTQYEEEMWKKTAVRRLSKMLPLQAETAQRIEVEEKMEKGTLAYDDVGPYDGLTGEVAPDELPPGK